MEDPTQRPGPSLAVDLAGISLKNPTMTASGTCGYAYEYADFVDMHRFAAFVTKSITREVRKGNESRRIVETRAGMLNAIGLANVGLDAFLKDKIPELQKMDAAGVPVFANVAGHSVDDYVHTSGRIAQEACVSAIELNVSCPNVSDGLTFGTDPVRLRELVRLVRDAMDPRVKLIVKLSPNAIDVVGTARAAVEGGGEILSLINTYTALAIDVNTRKPRLANGTGGLSGPAVRPLAVYWTHRVYTEVARDAGVPIIGMGGIQTWRDAAEFILAGASGLAIGTMLFIDPSIPVRVCLGLQDWLSTQGCRALPELVGALQFGKPAPCRAVSDFLPLDAATRDRFDTLLERVLDTLPQKLLTLLEEIPLIVEDAPSEQLMIEMDVEDPTDLCGLHDGIPLTEESVLHSGTMPSQITIYRAGLISGSLDESDCVDEEDLFKEIRITILHEIGHHFGLDEDELDTLGYG